MKNKTHAGRGCVKSRTSWPITALLFLTAATIGTIVNAEPAEPASSCVLLPRVLLVQAACERAEAFPDSCRWLAVIDDLLSGRREKAEEKLATGFDLSSAEARSILAVAAPYMSFIVDSQSCTNRQGVDIQERLLVAGLEGSYVSETALAFASCLLRRNPGGADSAISSADSFVPDPKLTRAIDGFVRILEAAEIKEDLLRKRRFQLSPVGFGNSEAYLTDGSRIPPELEELGSELAKVDQALDLAAQGNIGSARKAIAAFFKESADPTKGILLGRSGFGMIRLGRLEDGLSLLARADSWLKREGSGPLVPCLRTFIAYQRREVLQRLGLPSAVAMPSHKKLLPIISEFQRILFSVKREDERIQALAAAMRSEMESPDFSIEEFRPWWLAAIVLTPGYIGAENPSPRPPDGPPSPRGGLPGTGAASDDDTGPLKISRDLDLVRTAGRNVFYDWAWAKLRDLPKEYKSQSDYQKASRLYLQVIDVLERDAANLRLDEIARLTIDQNSEVYRIAFEMTALAGDLPKAFQVLERGRAFTLRRLFAFNRDKPFQASAKEQQAELAISRIERLPSKDRGELAKQYSSWEAARLNRRLIQVKSKAPPRPAAVTIERLQKEVLAEGETLLLFHIGDDRLWTWRITTGESDLRVISGLPIPSLSCLARSMRWPSAAVARRAEQRGTEVLIECPGVAGPTEPAVFLHNILIAPMEDKIAAGSRLIVIPHGPLHLVAFGALKSGRTGRWLAETLETSVAPSTDSLARLRRRLAERRGVPGMAVQARHGTKVQ